MVVKLTGHPGGIGVLVDKLHVFHQQLAGHAQLVADGTTAGVGTPHQGLVLQKKTFMSCNSSKTGLKYARTIRPLPDSARVKEKELKVSPRRILQERRPAVQRQSGCGEKSPNLDLDFAATARQNRQA